MSEWKVRINQSDGKTRNGSVITSNDIPSCVASEIVEKLHMNAGDYALFARVEWDFGFKRFDVIQYSMTVYDDMICCTSDNGYEFRVIKR